MKRARTTPAAAAAVVPAPTLALLRRLGVRVANEWVPRLSWSVGRSGRAGLAGMALLAASAVFLLSTHLAVVNEVVQLRADLATAQARARVAPPLVAGDPRAALRALPARADMPAVLGVLLRQADAAHLALDTGKYEMSASKAGGFVRYQLSFPVSGPYPQVREFIDSTLKAMPMVALSELALERKTIADGMVEAQIRLTVFARTAP